MMTNMPDKKYSDRKDNSLRPSWSDNSGYINEEHRSIFGRTKDIPGWQMEGDTYKLYEMAYYAGAVILEIGTFGGRSAVVEICGALSGPSVPQFFGIDVDINSIGRTYQTVKEFNLADYAFLYHGSLDQFMNGYSIHPTMCFVDGDHLYDGVKRDLLLLSKILSPGVPVLCHGFLNPENDTGEYGVRQAATEWEEEGYAKFYGVFGCSALFVTTDKCIGKGETLTTEEFAKQRKELLMTYGLEKNEVSDVSVQQEPVCHDKSWRSVDLLKYAREAIKKISGQRTEAVEIEIIQDNRAIDTKEYIYTSNENEPKWLGAFPRSEQFPLISESSRYGHDETQYDEQYQSVVADMRIGQGLVNLLHETGAEFSGTALEIGCGTGVLSLGLVNSRAFQDVIITDPSPIFLDITFNKMKKAMVDTSNVHFAVLKAEEIDRLPPNEFSMIALRSTLHHVIDVPKFIGNASLKLKADGTVVFQEPCTEGYILMGAIAQFIPIVLKQSGFALTDLQNNQIQSFISTMKFYAQRDVDKSKAEDKHLFRVDQIMKICESADLSVDFLPNMTFEHYAEPAERRGGHHSFYPFFYDYLKYCMSFEQPLLDLINKYFVSYCQFLEEISISNAPYMHGVFVCRKKRISPA